MTDAPKPSVNVKRTPKQDADAKAAVEAGIGTASDEKIEKRGDQTFRVRTVGGTEIATRVG